MANQLGSHDEHRGERRTSWGTKCADEPGLEFLQEVGYNDDHKQRYELCAMEGVNEEASRGCRRRR